MPPDEQLRVLARWTRELRYDLERATVTISALEARVHRLEHAARERALARRTWIRAGRKELV